MLLPEGTYKAICTEASIGQTRKGDNQLVASFVILESDQKGQRITWFGSFSNNLGKGTKTPRERTIEGMRACGFVGLDIKKLDSMLTREVFIVVEHDTWEGKTSAKVKWVNSSSGGNKKPVTGNALDAFAAELRKDLAASGGKEVVAAEDKLPF